MKSKRLFQAAILSVCFLFCWVSVYFIQKRLDVIKDEEKLVNMHVDERMTPRMAITVGALGAFRGLIADMLFLRMNAEKEKGNYFELMQLGELIIQLQPDMPGAITFIGWNMAYNISVTFRRHEDRWRWVNRGLEVIRDEALKYNPDDPEVIHQLAWIYQHKMGQILDDANRYYKGQLAKQIMGVLGDDENYDWQSLAAAPDSEDGLRRFLGLEMLGEALLEDRAAGRDSVIAAMAKMGDYLSRSQKPDSAAVDRLMRLGVYDRTSEVAIRLAKAAEAGKTLDDSATLKVTFDDFLLQVGRKSEFYKVLADEETTYRRLERDFRDEGKMPESFVEAFTKLGLNEKLDFYFRSKWLREVYKLDADAIYEMQIKYGYLDFRLPEAHAMYWARIGLKHSPRHANLNRIMAHSLARSIKWGRLRYLTKDGYAVVMPNLDNVDVVKQSFIDGLDRFDSKTGPISGFQNWVKDTVVILWMWGRTKKAQEYYDFLRSFDRFKQTDLLYKLPLAEYAMKLAAEDIGDKSSKQVQAMMFGMAQRCISAVAFDDQDQAELTLNILRRMEKRYYEEIKAGSRQAGRKKLPRVDEFLVAAKIELLNRETNRELWERYMVVGPQLPENDPRWQAIRPPPMP